MILRPGRPCLRHRAPMDKGRASPIPGRERLGGPGEAIYFKGCAGSRHGLLSQPVRGSTLRHSTFCSVLQKEILMLQLDWIKCNNGNSWCPLTGVDLSSVSTNGVYIIWHSGNPSRVVRVGQGDIANRLSAHRNDPAITQYPGLWVTWAAVPAAQRDGVERYLGDTWRPLVGDAFPNAHPIAVNSPWS